MWGIYLLWQFDTAGTLNMGDSDAAKAEATEMLTQVSQAKCWITRYLKHWKAHDDVETLKGDNFILISDKVQIQMDKLIDLHTAILAIYFKHSAGAEFQIIGDDIIDAIDRAQDTIDSKTAAVQHQLIVVAPQPPGDDVTEASLLDAVSHLD